MAKKMFDFSSSYAIKEREYIIANLYEKKERDTRFFRGSNAGYCPRRIVLTKEDMELYSTEVVKPSTNLFFKNGKCTETEILRLWEKNGILVTSDYTTPTSQSVKNKSFDMIEVFGTIDSIYKDNEGNLVIGEIKTIGNLNGEEYVFVDDLQFDADGNLKIEDIKAKSFSKFSVASSYLAQCLFYSAITGIDKANIIYISRRIIEKYGQDLAIEVVTVDTKYENLLYVLTNYRFSHYCLIEGVIPAVPPNFKKTVQCKYCQFSDNCWAKDNKTPSTREMELRQIATSEAKIILSTRNDRLAIVKQLIGAE